MEEFDLVFAKALATSEDEINCLARLMFAARKGILSLKNGSDFDGLRDRNLKEVVFFNDRVYLERNFSCLEKIRSSVERLSSSPLHFDHSLFYAALKGENLLKEQKEAAEIALKNSLTVIFGGPGSGKTYTASRIAHLLKSAYVGEPPFKIILAAPTGRAAFNLGRMIDGCEVMTIHSFLKKRNSAHLVIVDEASMIDVKLMAALLESVNGQLILIGDPNQLPPVEPGEIFLGFTNLKNSIYLTRQVRFESEDLLQFSELINRGDESAFSKEWKNITFLENIDPLFFKDKFSNLDDFRILSCLRVGPLGCDAINERFTVLKPFHPIVVTKNDHELNLYNGMLGLLKGDRVHFFPNSFPKEFVQYELAYALSVHKSQGGEFKEVVLFVPEGSQKFGKEMLYTAATRAKRKLTIVGKKATLLAMLYPH